MITKIFERVRRKAEQRSGDAFSDYWDAVIKPLAEGREVSEDVIVQSAEVLGRSPEQVEADVDLFRRRQQMVQELKQVPAWQSEAVKLQATIDRAAAELREHQQRLQTIIDSSYATKMQVEARIDGTRSHETDLARTCPNPSLASREQELTEQRRELQAKRQPLVESLGQGQGSLGGALSHAESQLEQFSDQAARGDTDSRQHVSKLKDYIAGYQSRIRQARQSLNELNEQLSTLDRELAQIRQQKLIP